MKRSHLISFAIVLAFFSGCENFFTGNIFSALDKPQITLDDPSDILNNLDSLDTLSEEDATAALNTLQNSLKTIDPEENKELYQETALAVADLSLSTSGADETINNLAPSLSSAMDDPSAILSDPDAAIASIFPEDASADEITEQLDAMLSAADAIESYGNTLDDSGNDNLSDTEKGDLAMQAVITGSVDSLVSNNMEQTGATEEEAVTDLADYIKSTQTGEEDPDNPYNDINLSGDFLSPSISQVASDGGIDL